MTLLTKLRTPVLSISLRNLHRTAVLLKNHVDPPDWDEKKFMMEFKPWENYTDPPGIGYHPDPGPYFEKVFDEPHGMKLIPYVWGLIILGIIPISIYAWYQEYQHLFVHPHRIHFPKHDFLHAAGHSTKFPWGDGKHTLMHHPYWNFTSQGYETDKDGNLLPPGVYAED